MKALFRNIRFYVLALSATISIVEYVWVSSVSSSFGKSVLLAQTYSLTAVIYLYLALLAGPFTKLVLVFPFRPQYLKARRAIGVSAFFFAALHIRYAFFDYLGGINGVLSLPIMQRIAIVLSSSAFVILSFMAATSFDKAVSKLTFPKWKMLHRFVYLAGFFILIHAEVMGSHFQDRFGLFSIILWFGVVFLVTLHIIGLYKKYHR